MKIIPLSEGAFTIDQTKIFIPFNPAVDSLQSRTPGSLLVEIQPFIIITERDVLLLDTGLGLKDENGQMQLHRLLKANGIHPAQVTKVLISHLHKDHAGGITFIDEHGSATLALPNATYYVNRQELEYAQAHDGSSYHSEDFAALLNSPAVVLLEDAGTIDGYIHYELTGGHSKYHMVFRIEENGETAFFGGDVAPQLSQMKKRFSAKYDFDGKKSMELRSLWWEEGQKNGWTFLFYHDIKTPMVTP